MKVLVADNNINENLCLCRYLSNDKNLDVISTSSAIETLLKYREIQPNILVIHSDFKDNNFTEVINELSSTSQERNNSNIILWEKDNETKLKLNYWAKIYKVIDTEKNYNELKDGIEQYYLDHFVFYEPSEENLIALFYKINLTNIHPGAKYFKTSIIECYNKPDLMNNLDEIYSFVGKKFNISYDSVRPAMRRALKSVNDLRNKSKNTGVFKLFENEDNITPKNFIQIITTYYLTQKYKRNKHF